MNSPYSRFGLGDIIYGGNAVNRSLGGISAPYADLQSINFQNPASYSHTKLSTFDVSAEIENRTLRNAAKTDKYSSANFIFNYLTVGVPLSKKKNWGMAFGLMPVTRIGYKVESRERLNTSQSLKDSILSLYEGSGGTYKGFIGTGYAIGGLSLGANVGYHFGQEDISTRRIFINDSLEFYRSNSSNTVSFGSFFADFGLQYEQELQKDMFIRFGATYNLQHTMSASKDVLRETYAYDANGGTIQIDSIYNATNIDGEVQYPSSYTVGLILQKADRWLIGVQYEGASWNNYRFYGQQDQVANSHMLRVGGQLSPALTVTDRGFFSHLTYRFGFYVGKDYVNVKNVQLPIQAVTVGFGIPVKRRSYYSNQFTTINLGFELGKRGNANTTLTDNFFRMSLGFSLSDIWFQKRKYD